MKCAWWLLASLSLLSCTAALAQEPPVMPQLVVNARYAYVTTYDGPSWSSYVLPEERRAVGDVEAALQAWGKYVVVHRPEEADIIVVVQKRPTEDTLAVYRGKPGASSTPLSRGTQGASSVPLSHGMQGTTSTTLWQGTEGVSSIPLWRGMQEGGLDSKELPLMTRFRKAVEAAAAPKR